MNYHQNNLLVKHKHTMWLCVGSLLTLAVVVTWSIVWSFGRYRQATQYTYVFHHKGAAVSIYDERSIPLITKLKPYQPYR
ncbi:hypothetical protein F5984_24170 [Rudanella paleaurantiibacter]|uniref:Uncharacterized protein n=1 Tax=Rudanella paleaurantiibacter TaxID=2614655 RepID=A0A7J5TT55_9BACT|nr:MULTISPECIES: hypothetical protein [Rudanella]KAB7726420.1 hypothetical protein F5984_24170 [Rudanella paleaurantiibacter]